MKLLKMFLVSSLAALFVLLQPICINSSLAGAAEMQNHGRCTQCEMDLNAFAQSRMLISYGDGSTAEVCSIHCAALDLRQNRDKQVKSIMAADYMTKEYIDARRATWVIGGNKPGGMNSPAEWAFATEADAQNFMK